MKTLTAALIALTALSATATFAQADDWDHHHRNWHRHHGPAVIVEHHRHGDWDRHHHWHPRPYHHEYHN